MNVKLSMNTDEKCSKCGKPGVVNGGLCLLCAMKPKTLRLDQGGRAKYDAMVRTIAGIRQTVGVLLDAHATDISQALTLSDGLVKIAFGVEIKDAGTAHLLDVRFRMVKERVRDSEELTVAQEPGLFDQHGGDQP